MTNEQDAKCTTCGQPLQNKEQHHNPPNEPSCPGCIGHIFVPQQDAATLHSALLLAGSPSRAPTQDADARVEAARVAEGWRTWLKSLPPNYNAGMQRAFEAGAEWAEAAIVAREAKKHRAEIERLRTEWRDALVLANESESAFRQAREDAEAAERALAELRAACVQRVDGREPVCALCDYEHSDWLSDSEQDHAPTCALAAIGQPVAGGGS